MSPQDDETVAHGWRVGLSEHVEVKIECVASQQVHGQLARQEDHRTEPCGDAPHAGGINAARESSTADTPSASVAVRAG